jgi:plastocyanin
MIGSCLVLGLTACSGGGGICTGYSELFRTAAATISVVPDPSTAGRFTPSSVSIRSGNFVTWKFTDSRLADDGFHWLYLHTVTADDGSFDSPCDGRPGGAIFSVKFDKAGTYKYHCRIHPGMLGEVKVR